MTSGRWRLDHRDQVPVELDRVDPHRPMPEEFPDRPVDPPAEEEDAPRVGMLQGGQVGEEFRLRPFGLEGEGVVLKTEICPARAVDGDPSVGGVPGLEEPRVVPGRHPPVEGTRPARGGCDQEGSETPAAATAQPRFLFSREEEQGRRRGDQAAGDGQG